MPLLLDKKLPVSHLRNPAVMGNDHQRFVQLPSDIAKKLHHLAAAFAVKISRRLVRKNNVRLCRLQS